jgi:ADP-ribose pyrophosphatase
VKARSQENPDYPERLPVADEAVRWKNAWPDYQPPEWTHPLVFANASDLPTGHKWADPSEVSAAPKLHERTTFSTEGGAAHAYSEALTFDAAGRPMNPVGRTGLAGRGLLGKWGANHAADPIVTRFCPKSGRLQVVAIQRKDTMQWAIPGGMVVRCAPRAHNTRTRNTVCVR